MGDRRMMPRTAAEKKLIEAGIGPTMAADLVQGMARSALPGDLRTDEQVVQDAIDNWQGELDSGLMGGTGLLIKMVKERRALTPVGAQIRAKREAGPELTVAQRRAKAIEESQMKGYAATKREQALLAAKREQDEARLRALPPERLAELVEQVCQSGDDLPVVGRALRKAAATDPLKSPSLVGKVLELMVT